MFNSCTSAQWIAYILAYMFSTCVLLPNCQNKTILILVWHYQCQNEESNPRVSVRHGPQSDARGRRWAVRCEGPRGGDPQSVTDETPADECVLTVSPGTQEGKEEGSGRRQWFLQRVLHVWAEPDPGVQGGEDISTQTHKLTHTNAQTHRQTHTGECTHTLAYVLPLMWQ